MEFINLVFSPSGSYDYHDASNIKMCILGRFLSSDVRCNVLVYKDWATNDAYNSASGNITSLDKTNDIILLSDLFPEEETPTELPMSFQQFIQLLDDWDEKVCKKRPKNVLIKHENDQFIIETSD